MKHIFQTIRHTARAATVLLLALLAAQTAGAQEDIPEVSTVSGLESAFGNPTVSVINVTDNITGVGDLPPLDRDLTINLNGHTISGDELYFFVVPDCSLTINGGDQGGSVGNIISGYADGPAIENDGTVTLRNVNITTYPDCAIYGLGTINIGDNVSFKYISDIYNAAGLVAAFQNTDVSVVNVTDNITVVGGLPPLNRDLTINLNGHTISGDELHFNVVLDGSLTINGEGQDGSVGNIIRGNAYGSPINNSGTVTLSHVNITTNSDCAINGGGTLYIGNSVSFNGWTGMPFITRSVNIIEDGNYNYDPDNPRATVVATVTVGGVTHYFENSGAALAYAQKTGGVVDFSLSGTTYTIHTATGWDAFCYLLEAGETFSGKTVELANDITVSRIAGSGAGSDLTASDRPFCGTFDGGGNKLTFNYGSSDTPADENNLAPFRYVNNATIQHLHVVGDIYTQHVHAGGIVGMAYGTTNITDCRSSVNIISSITGDGTHGGIMSCSWTGSTTSITGCLFDGSIQSASGYTTDQCGGFVGWRNATINVSNSLLTADLSTIDTPDGLTYPSATFVRNGNNNTITNCYYTQPFGTAQGKALHTVTAGTDVTVAHAGVATHYATSGITAYKATGASADSDPFIAGLLYNNNVVDVLYAGSGDVVSLTLSNTATGAPAGYQYAGYTANAGTLDDNNILTMPDEDVTVNLALAVLPWSGDGTEDSPYIIYNKDQLDLLAYRVNGTHGETANDYYNTYFKLNNDISYPHTTDWDDAECEQESNFEAIGGYYDGTDRYFRGHFDGNNKTISGIRIYKDGYNYADMYQGIFGATYSGADIHDLTLADTRITGYDFTGGIVGDNEGGTVSGCHVADDVAVCAVQSDTYDHGGIVGYNDGTIQQCTSAATLTTADASDSKYYGGIAGYNSSRGTLSDNLAIGATVPALSDNSYGAITGKNIGGSLLRNYYAACKVADTENATGVGCGYISDGNGGRIVADVTADNGAVSIHTLTLADGITTTTAVTVTIGTTGYYAQGTAIALSYSGTTGDGYQLGIVRNDGNGFTAAVADGDGHYTAVMPAANATATDHAPIDWATVSTGADKDNAYMIYNKDQLDLLAHRVNGTHGETRQTDGYENKFFQLAKDISYPHKADGEEGAATESNYEAIGSYYYDDDRYFCGHFDGNNKTISGIRIYKDGDGDADCFQGIFGLTVSGADIHDLTLADARITGYAFTGGIVGYNDGGTVSGCHVAADVAVCAVQSYAWYHGGIVGLNRGAIEQCTSAATLTTADADNSQHYGGIAGENNRGTLRDNLAIGATVPAAADNSYGAITGGNGGEVTLQRNYYANCKVADTENATGVGCGNISDGNGGRITADVTANNGAVCINTLDLTANQAPDGNYWTTYYNGTTGFTIDKNENACAYTATYGASQLTLHKLGKEIPAGTAVIIVAENDEVSMTATDLPAYSGPTNNLRGVDADTPVADIHSDLGDGTFYVLGMTTVGGEQHFGFHRYTGSTMAAHKAFVLVSGSPAQSARSLTMVFDEATGIVSAEANSSLFTLHSSLSTWFTLDGRRLQAKPTAPGIYVNNGRKVVIK